VTVGHTDDLPVERPPTRLPPGVDFRAGNYRVRWRYGGARDGKWQSVTAKTLDGAKELRRIVVRAGFAITRRELVNLVEGGRAGGSGESGAAWLRHFIDTRPGISDATRREYSSILTHQVEPSTLGALPLAAVTRDDAATWIRERKRSPKSVANYRALLSSAFAEAALSGRAASNPFAGMRIRRLDNSTAASDHVFLTADQVRAIGKRMTRDADIVNLLARTGLRWSELTALRVGDVDLDAPSLTVARAWVRSAGGSFVIGPPKTRKARRVIALDDTAAGIVKARVADRDADEWLVTAPNGRDALKRATFAPGWVAAVKAAVKAKEIPQRPRIHDLRHTHAAWLIAAGVPLPVIQARLGHESIQTTIDVYGHLMPETQKQVVAALNAM
jgi:integrase